MNTLKYKGYIGTVDISLEDNVFFGRIDGINALVNFEGETVEDLKKAFEEAVDDYLIYCEEEGVEPEKSYSGQFNVRIDPGVHKKIARIAVETGNSINNVVGELLKNGVNTFNPKPI